MATLAAIWRRSIDFIKLGRFLFLSGGFVFYGLGVAIAAYTGASIDWVTYAWGQVIVTLTQLMVHYSNDYFDLEADKANATPTRWSGGSRILPDGELSPRVALIAALGLLAAALLATAGLALVLQPGMLSIGVLLLAIGLSWFYSAPPIRLHSQGIGELSAALVLSILTPLAGFSLQSLSLDIILLGAVFPICFLQFNMLVGVALPDMEGDAQVGKKTLLVIVGRQKMRRAYLAAICLAYVALVLSVLLFELPFLVGLAGGLTLPYALLVSWLIMHGAWYEPRRWDKLAFHSIALLMSMGVLQLAAFLILI
jgi:1,4-dihydroxy-2-naphthoate octaprenyltransferase